MVYYCFLQTNKKNYFNWSQFYQVLKFNLTESGLLCVLPWFTMAVLANVGGWIADTLVSRGLSITSVRKARYIFWSLHVFSQHLLFWCSESINSSTVSQIMQSIGFLGPAFFLTQLSRVKTPAMAVLCMACSQVRHHNKRAIVLCIKSYGAISKLAQLPTQDYSSKSTTINWT